MVTGNYKEMYGNKSKYREELEKQGDYREGNRYMRTKSQEH